MKGAGWLIAIVGGYYLLEKLGYLPNLLAGNTLGNPVNAMPSTGTSPQANTQTSVVSANTIAAIIDAVKKAGIDPNSMQLAWTWNYYYTQVRGVQGPDLSLLFPNMAANASNEKFTLSEWWQAMTSAGFNGMGLIANHVDPYANPMHRPFGSYLTAQGSELFTKRIN